MTGQFKNNNIQCSSYLRVISRVCMNQNSLMEGKKACSEKEIPSHKSWKFWCCVNGGVIFADFSSVLLPLAHWSQFAGLQNCTQRWITTGNVPMHGFRPPVSPCLFLAQIQRLFLSVCTSEPRETPLEHLRNLITSDQVWGQSHGKILYYIWHAAFTKKKRKEEKYQNSKEKKKNFLGDVCQTAEIFKEFQWPQTWENA